MTKISRVLVGTLLVLAAPAVVGAQGASVVRDSSARLWDSVIVVPTLPVAPVPPPAAVVTLDTVARTSAVTGAVTDAITSTATMDSVHLVTQLLVANGAPVHRARPAAAAVMKYARLRALDPLLLVGIIGVENAELAPRSRSRVGATGVMQVMPFWKKYIRDCGSDLRDVTTNVCFGTRILRIAIDETTSLRAALLRYNGCVKTPGCHRYASAVFSQTGRAMLMSRAMSTTPTAAMPTAQATVAERNTNDRSERGT